MRKRKKLTFVELLAALRDLWTNTGIALCPSRKYAVKLALNTLAAL